MKKMIFILLLFISLTCSVCETFEVRSAQSFYQVFKNEDVTLEWTFTDSSLDSLQIFCYVYTHHQPSVLLQYDRGDEIPHHGLFEGRVQWDKDVLRERRIRLHVSSLRTEDSGDYSCEVKTSEGFDSASCNVIVKEKLKTAPETEDRNTGSGEQISLYKVPLALVLIVFGFAYWRFWTGKLKPVDFCKKMLKLIVDFIRSFKGRN